MATYFTSGTTGFELTAKWSLKVDSKLAPITDSKTHAIVEATTFGAGANKSNLLFADRRILAASQTDSLDLAGVLTRSGNTLTFAKIHAILVHNRSDETLTAAVDGVDHNITAAVLDVRGEGTNGVPIFKNLSDIITISAGDWMAVWFKTGITVTTNTGDLLNIVETAGAEAAYDIIVIGESA